MNVSAYAGVYYFVQYRIWTDKTAAVYDDRSASLRPMPLGIFAKNTAEVGVSQEIFSTLNFTNRADVKA